MGAKAFSQISDETLLEHLEPSVLKQLMYILVYKYDCASPVPGGKVR